MKVLKRKGHLATVDTRRSHVHLNVLPPEQLEQIRAGQEIQPIVQEVAATPGALERHDERVLLQNAQDLSLVQHSRKGRRLREGYLFHCQILDFITFDAVARKISSHRRRG